MTNMTAYQVNEYGPDARFEKTEIAVPELKSGQVLIEVKATSINPVDNKMLRTDYGFNPELPGILHGDVAGIVTKVADGVTAFKIGDEVFGCAGGFVGNAGALADYMPVDSKLIAIKPKNLSFKQAAAIPLAAITAWESIVDSGHIKAGEFILVHAGVGGVGHIAVQIAKAKGVKVATTVSSQDAAESAKQLGADETIIYTEENVDDYVKRLTDGEGFDLVYDTVSGKNIEKSLQAVRNYGRVVSVFTGVDSTTIDLATAYFKGASFHTQNMALPLVTGVGREHHGEIMRNVAAIAEEGKLKPLLDSSEFTVSQCNEAHAYFETGSYRGKVVLTND